MTQFRPGPLSTITDVPSIKVGQAHGNQLWSGAPGTCETDALNSASMAQKVHAVVLSGGSAYGLDAALAVVLRLAAQGRGVQIGDAIIPIVPLAILFDLVNGGGSDKNWGAEPPYRALAGQVMAALGTTVAESNAGAGYGAKADAYKGSLGIASIVTAEGHTVGTLVACNAFGTPVIPGTPCCWTWPQEIDDEFGEQPLYQLAKPSTHDCTFTPGCPGVPGEVLDTTAAGERAAAATKMPADLNGGDPAAAVAGGNTTIGTVAIDADLAREEAERIAIMARYGYARAVRPIHKPFGDATIFLLTAGKRPLTNPVVDIGIYDRDNYYLNYKNPAFNATDGKV